jgi:ABC-2 type transport system ATP-binding protein
MTVVIETSGLRRSFGAVRAVDGIDLSVPQASVFGFLGPNGAGKTTTIRMLLGLVKPDSGSVLLFGRPLEGERTSLLKRVGALVESPSIYPHLTGQENLRLTATLTGASRPQIDRALGIVRLEKDANRLAREYSTGMQQRLGVALALVSQPELLVLDEPTNGLDPGGIREMRDLVRTLPSKEGVTVFVSSHLLSEIEQTATHVGIVHRGRVLFAGALDALQTVRRPRIRIEVGDLPRASSILTANGWTTESDLPSKILYVIGPDVRPDTAGTLNRLLVSADVDVFHLAFDRPSLEETFLAMTETHAAVSPPLLA